MLTGQATQREAGARWGIDRSTVVSICRTAKQVRWTRWPPRCPAGRPGQAREVAELAAARAEIERLRGTVTEQAVVLHLHQGKSRWD